MTHPKKKPAAPMQEDVKAVGSNPHWVGEEPAWDISIGNITIKSVTASQIKSLQTGYDRYGIVTTGDIERIASLNLLCKII